MRRPASPCQPAQPGVEKLENPLFSAWCPQRRHSQVRSSGSGTRAHKSPWWHPTRPFCWPRSPRSRALCKWLGEKLPPHSYRWTLVLQGTLWVLSQRPYRRTDESVPAHTTYSPRLTPGRPCHSFPSQSQSSPTGTRAENRAPRPVLFAQMGARPSAEMRTGAQTLFSLPPSLYLCLSVTHNTHACTHSLPCFSAAVPYRGLPAPSSCPLPTQVPELSSLAGA